MVPTPRAQALRGKAAAVVRSLGALLSPGASVDPVGLRSTFTLQATDLVGAALAPGLLRLAETCAHRRSLTPARLAVTEFSDSGSDSDQAQ